MWTMEQILLMRAQIEDSVKSVTDDSEALERKWMFPPFDPNGHHYLPSDRFTWGGELYKVKDGMEHDSQSDWTPDVAVSLYERIAKPTESGTADNPIVYAQMMAIEEGKYYAQNGVTYYCFRDMPAMPYDLSVLIEQYVRALESEQ